MAIQQFKRQSSNSNVNKDYDPDQVWVRIGFLNDEGKFTKISSCFGSLNGPLKGLYGDLREAQEIANEMASGLPHDEPLYFPIGDTGLVLFIKKNKAEPPKSKNTFKVKGFK